MMKRRGALAYQELEQLMASGFLDGFTERSVQPASADLSLGEEIYRVRGSVLPLPGVPVRNFLRAATLFSHSLAQPLEPEGTYLARVAEQVRFHEGLYGFTNPKSSAGRVDLHVRVVADGEPRFDSVPRGFQGELWFLITTGHFLVKLTPGDALAQLRVFDADTMLDETEMADVYPRHRFFWTSKGKPLAHRELKISDRDGSLIMTLDLAGSRTVGYQAKTSPHEVLAFNKKGHRAEDFFEAIERSRKGRLVLDKGGFYIFCTKEYARVPPEFACEMVAYDQRSGEFRSHYAGFIDPGWGHGRDGEHKGWPLVLEVRPFVRDVVAVDGGPMCRLRYERMRQEPVKVYGEADNNYTFQKGPFLSKHFRQG